MDGQIGNIPGYYYDKEKRKYFKIQASGAAPASSAYSSQDVKRRKLEDATAEALALGKAQLARRIKRSAASRDISLSELLAEREIYSPLSASQIFAGGLVEQSSFFDREAMNHTCTPFFEIDPQFHTGPSRVTIRIVDEYLSTASVILKETPHKHERFSSRRCVGLTVKDILFDHDNLGGRSDPTSFSVNRTHQVAMRTWLASNSQTGISISRLVDEESFGTLFPDHNDVATVIGTGTSRGPEVNVYSSTPAPGGSNLLFAVGTTGGIMTIDSQTNDAHFITPRLDNTQPQNTPVDVFALEFFSNNPSILLSGERKGILHVIDLRVPPFGSDADTILHPSCITHIKQLDSHRILVSGLYSSLCQYDLRYRKTDTSGPDYPRKKSPFGYNANHTRSILDYPDFHNSATIYHGLDVDLETGVVAVAQEHDSVHRPVQIFSLHGGHKLRSPRLEAFTLIYPDQVMRCVKWVEDVKDRAKSLYIGCNGIFRYGWTGDDDDGMLMTRGR